MKILKRFIIFILFFNFVLGVNAAGKAKATVTLDQVVKKINNGEITEEYLEQKKAEIDENTGEEKWKEVKLNGEVVDNETIVINYSFMGEEESVSGSVTAYVQEDDVTLKSVLYFNEEEDEIYKYDVEIHNLLPLWEIESTTKFEDIQKYIDKDYINRMNEIIDRCYRQEMHVCRTTITTYGDREVISDVELNNEAAKYLLNVLEERAAEEEKNRFNAILIVVAIILILLLLLTKSMNSSSKPKKQPLKY